jgi:hypothetical protein
VVSLEEADEVADGAMSVPRVAEWEFAVDVVVVAAAVALLGQVSGAFEVADDLRDRSLGDADALGDVTQARLRVDRDALEDAGVVRHEPPAMIIPRAVIHVLDFRSTLSRVS